jgi:hypothetical protein
MTSAVQRRQDTLLEISRVCRIPANRRFSASVFFSSVQKIYSGCCTVAALGCVRKLGSRPSPPGYPGQIAMLLSGQTRSSFLRRWGGRRCLRRNIKPPTAASSKR